MRPWGGWFARRCCHEGDADLGVLDSKQQFIHFGVEPFELVIEFGGGGFGGKNRVGWFLEAFLAGLAGADLAGYSDR